VKESAGVHIDKELVNMSDTHHSPPLTHTRVIARWALLTLIMPILAMGADYIQPLEPSTTPIHVRVLFESNHAHEAVIAWTTTAPGEHHHVYLDTEPRTGDLAAYAQRLPSVHSAPYTLRPNEEAAGMHAWSHNVHLTDLTPWTTYYLTVVSDDNASHEYHFMTAPDDDQVVRMVAVGDSRTPQQGRTHPENDRRQVNALMARLLERHPTIIAMLHGADYTNRALWGELYWWLKDHAEMTTTSDNRLLPIIPSRGNHDLDIGFEEMFWWPDRENDFYYTTRLNAQAAVITLNSEISRGGDQRDWLEQQLIELRPEKQWLLAMYHRPAYPSVRDYGSGAPQRGAWVPLFEAHGLDAAYESHDHALKRTYPIYDGRIDAVRGVVYFGDGGAGVPQRRPDPDRWYLQVTGRYHHTHLLSFEHNRLHIQAISIDDAIVDDFTLHPRGLRTPYTGLERPGAFISHLANILDERPRVDPVVHEMTVILLRSYLAHYSPEAPDSREDFLETVRGIFADGNAEPVARRMAYQLLLLHADWAEGEHKRLLAAGQADDSAEIRELVETLGAIALDSDAGQALIKDLSGKSSMAQRVEEAFSAVRDVPDLRLPEGLDDDTLIKVEAFRLPVEGWAFRLDPSRLGYFQGWHEMEPDDTWKPFEIEKPWAQVLGEDYAGAGWYRRMIAFPELAEDFDRLTLHFGGIDEMGWVWIDGQYVGQQNIGPTGWNQPFELDVSDHIRPGERHEIIIRVMNTAYDGGIWQPIHLHVYQGLPTPGL